MTEQNLIINGVEHAKFDLEWAKRGGVIYHADDGWQILKFVRVLGSKRIKISAKLLRPNEKQVLQPFKN